MPSDASSSGSALASDQRAVEEREGDIGGGCGEEREGERGENPEVPYPVYWPQKKKEKKIKVGYFKAGPEALISWKKGTGKVEKCERLKECELQPSSDSF